ANQGKAIREQRERLLSDLGAANVAELDELLTASESEALAAAERRSAAANAKDVAVAARAVGHGLEADFSALETLRVLADDLHSKTEQIEHLSVVVERASKAATLSDSRDHLDQRTEEHARLQVEVSRAEAARKATRAALEDARSELERAEASDRSALEAADLRYKHLLSQRENVAGLNALRTSLAEARHVLEEGTGRLVSVDEALAELKSRIDELEEEAQQTTVVASELDAAREALVATAGDLDAWDRLTALDVELKSVDSEIERARAEDARHHLETAVRTNAP